MKDLGSQELQRYRVSVPLETRMGLQVFFPGAKVDSFEFPIQQAKLKTIVSTCTFRGMESTRITASIQNPTLNMACIVTIDNVYFIQEQLQHSEECMVWQYNPVFEKMRAATFRATKGTEFDMNGVVLHLHEYVGEMPPLKEAYDAKMQKNRGFYYGKGALGEWRFVHVKADRDFPWKTLQEVSEREFGQNLVQVFFNKETKEHPDEFVLWYNPIAKLMV